MLLNTLAATSRSLPYFRGKQRLLNALTPRKGLRTATVFGLPMLLDLSEYIQREVFLGYYEHRETVIVRSLLTNGSVFVDVGANIGWYTALAASIVGTTGKVLSFEPSPHAYKLLSQTVVGASNVMVFNIGLSDHEGVLRLFVPPETYGNHDPSMVEYCAGMTPITVPVKRLGQLLEELDVPTVDVMKIDVEAHEPEVFAGCEEFLRSGRIRNIFCEFNDLLLRQRGSSSRELLAYLRALGYRPEDAPASFDDTLVNVLLSFGG
jgi:FkbM family methyltransferase